MPLGLSGLERQEVFRKDYTEHSNTPTDGQQVSLGRDSNVKKDMEVWKSMENSAAELVAFKVCFRLATPGSSGSWVRKAASETPLPWGEMDFRAGSRQSPESLHAQPHCLKLLPGAHCLPTAQGTPIRLSNEPCVEYHEDKIFIN